MSVGQVLEEVMEGRWTFPVEDAERVALADLATAECATVQMTATVQGYQGPAEGQRACFQGTYTLVDTAAVPEVVVATRTVPPQCTTAPQRSERSWPLTVDLAPGTDLTALELRVSATSRLYCLQVGADTGTSTIHFGHSSEAPMLVWPGCTPGFYRD